MSITCSCGAFPQGLCGHRATRSTLSFGTDPSCPRTAEPRATPTSSTSCVGWTTRLRKSMAAASWSRRSCRTSRSARGSRMRPATSEGRTRAATSWAWPSGSTSCRSTARVLWPSPAVATPRLPPPSSQRRQRARSPCTCRRGPTQRWSTDCASSARRSRCAYARRGILRVIRASTGSERRSPPARCRSRAKARTTG